jgi:hypothetical protein
MRKGMGVSRLLYSDKENAFDLLQESHAGYAASVLYSNAVLPGVWYESDSGVCESFDNVNVGMELDENLIFITNPTNYKVHGKASGALGQDLNYRIAAGEIAEIGLDV